MIFTHTCTQARAKEVFDSLDRDRSSSLDYDQLPMLFTQLHKRLSRAAVRMLALLVYMNDGRTEGRVGDEGRVERERGMKEENAHSRSAACHKGLLISYIPFATQVTFKEILIALHAVDCSSPKGTHARAFRASPPRSDQDSGLGVANISHHLLCLLCFASCIVVTTYNLTKSCSHLPLPAGMTLVTRGSCHPSPLPPNAAALPLQGHPHAAVVFHHHVLGHPGTTPHPLLAESQLLPQVLQRKAVHSTSCSRHGRTDSCWSMHALGCCTPAQHLWQSGHSWWGVLSNSHSSSQHVQV